MGQIRNMALWACLLAGPIDAQAEPKNWEVFGSWVYRFTEDDPGNNNQVAFNKSWLVNRTELDDETEAIIFLALQGQEMLVHDFRVRRYLPFVGFDQVVFGRFIPPFGREWSDVRYDHLPTVFYSSITDSVVARDNGARLDMSYGWLRLNLGLFAGNQRQGGFIKERKDSKLHFYQRCRLELPYGFTLGASYRYARTRNDLWAAEASWFKPGMEFAIETVSFDDNTQWYFLFYQEVAQYVWAVLRYENLTSGNRIVPGVKIKLEHMDLKFNAVLDGEKNSPKVFLIQAIVRY